jgi:hypothetical protein
MFALGRSIPGNKNTEQSPLLAQRTTIKESDISWRHVRAELMTYLIFSLPDHSLRISAFHEFCSPEANEAQGKECKESSLHIELENICSE